MIYFSPFPTGRKENQIPVPICSGATHLWGQRDVCVKETLSVSSKTCRRTAEDLLAGVWSYIIQPDTYSSGIEWPSVASRNVLKPPHDVFWCLDATDWEATLSHQFQLSVLKRAAQFA